MKITVSTRVDKNYLEVKEGFTEKLFLNLNPPFPPVKLLRFDGSSKGDIVILELNFFIFKQKWTSKITADHTDENEFYFIDEGIELPFFLKKWKHKHRVIKSGNGSLIKDEIDYTGKFGLMTLLLFPVLYGQFLYRKPVYKKIFQLRSS
jgi:ligand-binding SRPBCC domain-containing protein